MREIRELLAPDADELAFEEAMRHRKLEEVDTPKGVSGRSISCGVRCVPLLDNPGAIHPFLKHTDRHFGKEHLQDLIAKKREMFFLQYALGVKSDEITKLEEIAQAEEQKLLEDEKALEEDAAKFDAFLKENDKNSVEAIKK